MTAAVKNPPATNNKETGPTNTSRKIIGALLVGVAAVVLLGITTRTSDSSTETFGPRISAIDLQSTAGTITLRATDADVVTVTARRKGRFGNAPHTTSEVDAGTLKLEARCGEVLPVAGECSTAYVVDIPDGVAVTAQSLAGSLEADGLTGGLAAEISAGRIKLHNVSGDIDIATLAGSIEAVVNSDRVRATSGAGAVSVTNTLAPTELVAKTEAGGIEVLVPPNTYHVDARSSAGRVAVEVQTDPDAPRTITAYSTVGPVRVGTSSDR